MQNTAPLDLLSVMRPTARQRMALEAVRRYKFVLYGGAGGGGKSMWLRWTLLLLLVDWAARGHRNVRVGLFSKDYPTLRDRQISKIALEFADFGEVTESQID